MFRQMINVTLCFLLAFVIVSGSPLKFPGQESRDNRDSYRYAQNVPQAHGEGRFININTFPSGHFNRLTSTNKLQDDIEDYDDSVVGSSGITSPTPAEEDTQSRRGHRRRRPCSIFRSNGVGRRDHRGDGRTFFNIYYNDYNYYGNQGHGYPQHDSYPCSGTFGDSQNHRPQKPGGGGGALSDDVGGNRPGWAQTWFGQGGIIDVNNLLSNWVRPGVVTPGGGALGDPTADSGSSSVKPIVELNVQDSIQNVVSTTGGLFGAVQGLFMQTPVASAASDNPASSGFGQNDEPERDPLIQPRPTRKPRPRPVYTSHHRPHRPLHHYLSQQQQLLQLEQQDATSTRPQFEDQPVTGVTQITSDITSAVNPATGPQTFGADNDHRRSVVAGNKREGNGRTGLDQPWWSFFGLFN